MLIPILSNSLFHLVRFLALRDPVFIIFSINSYFSLPFKAVLRNSNIIIFYFHDIPTRQSSNISSSVFPHNMHWLSYIFLIPWAFTLPDHPIPVTVRERFAATPCTSYTDVFGGHNSAICISWHNIPLTHYRFCLYRQSSHSRCDQQPGQHHTSLS